MFIILIIWVISVIILSVGVYWTLTCFSSTWQQMKWCWMSVIKLPLNQWTPETSLPWITLLNDPWTNPSVCKHMKNMWKLNPDLTNLKPGNLGLGSTAACLIAADHADWSPQAVQTHKALTHRTHSQSAQATDPPTWAPILTHHNILIHHTNLDCMLTLCARHHISSHPKTSVLTLY